MINENYFESGFQEQLRCLGPDRSVEIILYSGARYLIHTLSGVYPGYLQAEVYPPEGTANDQVAIAYESISEVLITKRKQKQLTFIGFGPEAQREAATSS